MAKFQSYARPEGFNPIRVPDETNKYLAQGQQALQSMQRAMDFDLQNRNRYLSAMQNMQEAEAQNRDVVFRRDAQNRQTVQNQVQDNYQQTIRQAELQGRQELATLQSLAAFSQTAVEALGKFNEKREEGIKLGVQQAMFSLGGLDVKTLQEIHKLDRNLTDQALGENQFIKRLLESGNGSIQDIRYLMKHSNAKYWSESRSLAEQAGINYGNYVNQNYDTKFKVREGVELSYAEARAAGDQEAQQTIISQLRSNYLKESGALNLSPQIAGAYVHPAMRAFENQLQQASNAEYKKLVDMEVDNNINRSFAQGFESGGSQWGAQYLASLPAGAQRSAGKANLLRFFATAANGQEWEYYQEVFQELLTQPTALPDGTETTLGEFWKNDPSVIEVSRAFVQAKARAIQDFNLEQSEMLTQRSIAEKDFVGFLESLPNGYTDADIDAVEARLDQIAPGFDSQRLDSMRRNESTNAQYRQKVETQLQDLADRGLLTKERIQMMGIPGTIAAKWMNIAEATSKDRSANQNFKPQLEALSILAQSPPQVAAKIVGGKYHWTVPLMEQQLHNEFYRKYSELKAAGDPGAIQNALSFVTTKFQAQSKNPKFFNAEGGYTQYTTVKTPSTASSARMQWVQGRIRDLGVKALDTMGAIYTVSELNTIRENVAKPGFKMDPMAEYIGRQMGVDPFTVINRQLKASDMPLISLPQSTVSFSTTVNAELKRKLDAYQTPQLSTRAMTSTRTFNPSLIPKGYGPLVVEAAQKAGINPAFVAAFAEAENTNWDPNALSMGGAAAGVGLMQLSQEFHGPGATRAERERALKDPRLNLTLGAGILSGIYKRYGNWKDTVYVWNMGETGFKNWVAAGRPNTTQAGYAKNLYERFEKARAKYGDVSALRSAGTMRQSMQRLGATSFERPSSVVFESSSGQPGVDLYFESKRFPAVLGGVVKDVSREPGYGNYVVVESVDPMTGQKVDVLYGHLADGVSLRPGQRLNAGDIIGTQGGTGNVRSADGTIASIDFLAPAPRGSKSMTPYTNYQNLRQFIVTQLQR